MHSPFFCTHFCVLDTGGERGDGWTRLCVQAQAQECMHSPLLTPLPLSLCLCACLLAPGCGWCRPEMMEDEEEYYDSVGTHSTKNADYYYSRVEGNKNFDHWFGGGSHFAAAGAEATFSMELDGEGNEEGGRGGAEEEEEEGVRGGTSGAPAAFMAPPPPQHAAAPHRSWGGGF